MLGIFLEGFSSPQFSPQQQGVVAKFPLLILSEYEQIN